MMQLNPRDMEESLSGFVRRFPVSGRVVHALAREFGGVMGLVAHLERSNLGEEIERWMTAHKAGPLKPETFHRLFDDSTLESVGRELGISLESVEIQAGLGIPKFFSMVGLDDDLDLGLGYHTKKKKPAQSGRSGARV